MKRGGFLGGSVLCFVICALLVVWFLTLTVGCAVVADSGTREYNFATKRLEPVPAWRVSEKERAEIAATVEEMKRSAVGHTFAGGKK